MITPLKKEDWDFSNLPAGELRPALFWESRRECAAFEQAVVTGRAWLAGKLSTKRAPMPPAKRTGKRPPYHISFSEAEAALARTTSQFLEFIPFLEAAFIRKPNAKQRAEHERWLTSHLRPLLENYHLPWLCLSEAERKRQCEILNRIEDLDAVHLGTWWDAVDTFKKQKPRPYLPLKFDFPAHTSVLLTINWRNSKERILAGIGRILKQIEPPGTKPRDRRGKKARDLLVMLERLAIMRLLHHYTLAELKRRLPEAWSLYHRRKWYDDRRRALKDFRSVILYPEPGKVFPKSWQTKAQRARNKTPLLPAK
jgi:hypothetical protein